MSHLRWQRIEKKWVKKKLTKRIFHFSKKTKNQLILFKKIYRSIFFLWTYAAELLFSCGHATLWEALSICWSVGPLVSWFIGLLVRWSVCLFGPLVREQGLKSSILDAPLCPTRYRPFGAAALLSLYFFSWSLQAWHWAPPTMHNPWMNCLPLPLPTRTQLGSHVSSLVLKQKKGPSPSSSWVC